MKFLIFDCLQIPAAALEQLSADADLLKPPGFEVAPGPEHISGVELRDSEILCQTEIPVSIGYAG